MLPTPPPAIVKMAMPTYAASQSAISVKLNQPFQIRMHVNSGTGYTWQPQGPLPAGIALIGVYQQPHGKIMPGVAGTEVFVFRGTAATQSALTLEYVRPWEKNVKPAKVQNFTVTIHR